MTSAQAKAIKEIDIQCKQAKKAVLDHNLKNGYNSAKVYLTVSLVAYKENSTLEYGVY